VHCSQSEQKVLIQSALGLLREKVSELYVKSTHFSLWGHDRLIGRGVPGVSFVSCWCTISLFGLPQGKFPRSPRDCSSDSAPNSLPQTAVLLRWK